MLPPGWRVEVLEVAVRHLAGKADQEAAGGDANQGSGRRQLGRAAGMEQGFAAQVLAGWRRLERKVHHMA
ncbi:hypothetical protein SDC9_190617 [bioreactor metagenome]|uniref:Uncharacterized protein n=1 Tax=bioreactor metagenome TaxID=1076179 RepID=A0A645HVL2_9ZZZZ